MIFMSIFMNVLCRPVVNVLDQHVTSVEGKTISLSCEIESYPRDQCSIQLSVPFLNLTLMLSGFCG